MDAQKQWLAFFVSRGSGERGKRKACWKADFVLQVARVLRRFLFHFSALFALAIQISYLRNFPTQARPLRTSYKFAWLPMLTALLVQFICLTMRRENNNFPPVTAAAAVAAVAVRGFRNSTWLCLQFHKITIHQPASALASFILVIGALIAAGGCRFSWLFLSWALGMARNAFLVNSWQGVGPACDAMNRTHRGDQRKVSATTPENSLLGHAKFNSHKIPVIQHPTDGDECHSTDWLLLPPKQTPPGRIEMS